MKPIIILYVFPIRQKRAENNIRSNNFQSVINIETEFLMKFAIL